MKASYQLQTVPPSGVKVTIEGMLVRLLFDIVAATPVVMEGEEAPDDLYDCESVDSIGRGYDDIVNAIINDRYPSDKVQAVMANYSAAQDPESELTAPNTWRNTGPTRPGERTPRRWPPSPSD